MKFKEVAVDIFFPDSSKYARELTPPHIRKFPIGYKRDSRLSQAVSFGDALSSHFESNHYDIVITDGSPLQWFSMVRYPECPHINIANVFLTGLDDGNTLQKRWLQQDQERLNRLRIDRGLCPISHYSELYQADHVLLADPRPIVEQFGDLPKNFHGCGACTWTFEGEEPKELNGMSDFLLLSMGSTGASLPDVELTEAIQEFTSSRHVLYAGSRAPKAARSMDQLRAFEWLPLDRLLPRCKAVISQGGTGSTYQALAAGCPLFLLPSQQNHQVLTDIICNLNLGVDIGAASILRDMSLIDYDVIERNIAKYSKAVANENGAVAIAKHVYQLV